MNREEAIKLCEGITNFMLTLGSHKLYSEKQEDKDQYYESKKQVELFLQYINENLK